jgi:hypothetical protein
MRSLHTKGEAPAGSPAIKPKYKARFFRCPAMNVRENTQRPVITMHQCRAALFIFEAGPPHQGPVTEYPKIAVFTVSHHEPQSGLKL